MAEPPTVAVWHRDDPRVSDNAALDDRPREALPDPEIRRRASLSQRHGRQTDDDDATSGQCRLDHF